MTRPAPFRNRAEPDRCLSALRCSHSFLYRGRHIAVPPIRFSSRCKNRGHQYCVPPDEGSNSTGAPIRFGCNSTGATLRGLRHRSVLYCVFGCVLGGAVLDGAALGCALALVCFFFFGAVSAPGVTGAAIVSCWASAADAVSSAEAGTASPVASPASKSTFRREIRFSRIGKNLPSQPHQTPRG
jgi:hypothetical protein